jgi:hypothetical protein
MAYRLATPHGEADVESGVACKTHLDFCRLVAPVRRIHQDSARRRACRSATVPIPLRGALAARPPRGLPVVG